MSRHRHRSHYQGNTGNPLGTLVKYLALLVILAGAGGATWLALTPMDAPTREVVRPVSLPPAE